MHLVRSHLTYANVISTLCLVLIVGGGVAYAANTVFSADIVDGEVKTADLGANSVNEAKIAGGAVVNGKLKNDAVTSPKVLNETLVGGDVKNNALKGADIDESTLSSIGGGGPAGGDLTGDYPDPLIAPDAVGSAEVEDDSLTADDLARHAVGVDELQGAQIFDARDEEIGDSLGGGATEQILLDLPTHQLIARCLENPSGTVKADIVVKSVGSPDLVSAVDSNAPNGVNNVTNLAHEAETTLISVGPTTFRTWHTGQYAVTSEDDGLAGIEGPLGFNGNVAASTHFGATECRFQATALGGGSATSPE